MYVLACADGVHTQNPENGERAERLLERGGSPRIATVLVEFALLAAPSIHDRQGESHLGRSRRPTKSVNDQSRVSIGRTYGRSPPESVSRTIDQAKRVLCALRE